MTFDDDQALRPPRANPLPGPPITAHRTWRHVSVFRPAGDFDKGEEDGALASLRLIEVASSSWCAG